MRPRMEKMLHTIDDDDGRMSEGQEGNDVEHGKAIEEEEFYREVDQRRIHLEQPALESDRGESDRSQPETGDRSQHRIGDGSQLRTSEKATFN